jgi:hypothetical protein
LILGKIKNNKTSKALQVYVILQIAEMLSFYAFVSLIDFSGKCILIKDGESVQRYWW